MVALTVNLLAASSLNGVSGAVKADRDRFDFTGNQTIAIKSRIV